MNAFVIVFNFTLRSNKVGFMFRVPSSRVARHYVMGLVVALDPFNVRCQSSSGVVGVFAMRLERAVCGDDG